MEREMQVQRVNLSSVDPPSASVFEGAQQTRKEESRPSSLCPIKDSSLIHSPAKRCLERGGALRTDQRLVERKSGLRTPPIDISFVVLQKQFVGGSNYLPG